VPNGVITIRRRALPNQFTPKWSESRKGLAPMHLTTAKRIEDINCVLQVNEIFPFIYHTASVFLG